VILCGLSFLGSLIAGALGLGGGVLVLATMANLLPPTVLSLQLLYTALRQIIV